VGVKWGAIGVVLGAIAGDLAGWGADLEGGFGAWIWAIRQGLFKVEGSGLSSQPVIPAEAGIQDILSTTTFWIPACAGMTD